MKIFCVGRNYIEHAQELGNDIPEQPIIFMKPTTSIVKDNHPVYYPAFTKDLHYEGELVVKISKNGKSIQKKYASEYYHEVTVGFDLTARDIQSDLKKRGLPWEIAKGFDGAAPIGRFIEKSSVINKAGAFEYEIYKGEEKVQHGDSTFMIFKIDDLIVYISKFFTLQKGDLIFTGTPKGVGPLNIGDKLSGRINNLELINFYIK